MTKTRRDAGLVSVAVAVVIAGCQTLTVPDFNNPGLDELTESPSRSAVQTAVQGLMIGARKGIGEFNRYVAVLGAFGRESYIFEGTDSRFITEIMQGPLDPGGASFGGGGHWADRYANVRAANILLAAVDAAPENFSSEEAEAIRGWAKTFQAHDFLLVVNTRDDFGAPIDVGIDPTADPAPIVDRDAVFAHILQLLDEAATHLASGGSAFPFQQSSGFEGFDTPATFRTFARGLKARVLVYRASLGGGAPDWTEALNLLNGSETFINDQASTVAELEVGVYHAFGSGPGDVLNGLREKAVSLPTHPSIVTDAQAGDQRVDRKTAVLSAPVEDPAGLGVTTDRTFALYPTLSSPIPLIRNEELILLRAEANLQLGNLSGALDDINLIRTVSGGLPAIDSGAWGALTPDERIDEILYNRRYSLFFEGGHRWIDMRRYDRLMDLPVDHPSFVRFRQFPFPANECLARGGQPAQACAQIPGF